MGDDICSRSICFDFRTTKVVHLMYGPLTTIDYSLSLNPNRCHHPLITQLSLNIVFFVPVYAEKNDGKLSVKYFM